MHYRIVAMLAAAVTVAAFAPLPAHAGCEEKVAEIDAWLADTDVDPNTLSGVQMMRDQGAAMCAQGNEAAAMQMLGMVALALPQTKSQVAAEQQVNAESKAKITDQFLAGTWCAIVDQEHSQYIFPADGTYRACVHDSMAGPYGHCMPPQQRRNGWQNISVPKPLSRTPGARWQYQQKRLLHVQTRRVQIVWAVILSPGRMGSELILPITRIQGSHHPCGAPGLLRRSSLSSSKRISLRRSSPPRR